MSLDTLEAAIRQEILDDKTHIENLWQEAGGGEGVLVVGVLNPDLKKYEGKNVCRLGDPLFHNKKNIMG